MSWLRQTVNSKLGSFKDQLNNILAEDDEVIDPEKTLKLVKDKLIEQERQVEILKNENNRFKESENEITEKYLALELQYENLSANFKKQIQMKDALINELHQQVNSLQSISSNKSPFMMDFEEIMPSSEINNYIHLEKELKRLQDDNKYLLEENEKLREQLRLSSGSNDVQKYQVEIEALKNQLKNDKEKHQEEILAMQINYRDKITQLETKKDDEKKKNESLGVWRDISWNNLEDIELKPDIDVDELRAENEKLTETVKKLEEEELTKLANYQKLESQLAEKDNEIRILTQKLDDFKLKQDKLVDNDNELASKNNEIEILRDKIQEIEVIHKNEKDELSKKYESLKTTNETCQETNLKELTETISTQKLQIDELNNIIKQKETENIKIQEQEMTINDLTQNLNAMHVERSQLLFFLNQKNEESLTYYNEIQRLNETIMNLNQEMMALKNEYSNLESEFQSSKKLTDELSSEIENLREILNEYQVDSANQIQIKQENIEYDPNEVTILNEKIKELEFELKKLSNERDQVIMDLKKNELNQRTLIEKHNEQVNRLNKELERLREHLVEMSESYTKEAINAENKEKDLRTIITQAEDTIYKLNEKLGTIEQEAQKFNEQLSKENQLLKEENKTLQSQFKQADDLYQTQLRTTKNLELVLERLQKDKDTQHTIEISKYQDTIKQNAVTIFNLQNELSNLKAQLSDMKDAVGAAARLNEKIEKNDETISYLQQKVNEKDEFIQKLELKLHEIQQLNNNYIEKEIIKNLLIGYLKVPQNERKQVLRLMGSMLNFSQSDYDQLESTNSEGSRWLPSLFSGTTSRNPSPNKEDLLNKSFTDLLIQYVDRESKPKPRFSLSISNDKKNDSSSASIIQSSFQPQTNSPMLLNRNTTSRDSPIPSSINPNNSFLEDILK